MYAQAVIKPNLLLRNGAYGIVMRGVQKCTCAGASLRGRNSAPLCCIKLDTATDLGCGTGLELDFYFEKNPEADVTGIDLADDMLDVLEKKHGGKALRLIRGSYFEEDFGTAVYDAAVSVESLHHFTKAQKIPLYRKVKASLKPGGYFVLTDYLAPDEEWENRCFAELNRRKEQDGITDDGSYHHDIPLTVPHEIEALRAGGFSAIEVIRQWENTYTIIAK